MTRTLVYSATLAAVVAGEFYIIFLRDSFV